AQNTPWAEHDVYTRRGFEVKSFRLTGRLPPGSICCNQYVTSNNQNAGQNPGNAFHDLTPSSGSGNSERAAIPPGMRWEQAPRHQATRARQRIPLTKSYQERPKERVGS